MAFWVRGQYSAFTANAVIAGRLRCSHPANIKRDPFLCGSGYEHRLLLRALAVPHRVPTQLLNSTNALAYLVFNSRVIQFAVGQLELDCAKLLTDLGSSTVVNFS